MHEEMIKKTHLWLQQHFNNEATGHDYWHFLRVSQIAKHIALLEQADVFIVELSALLHDVGDWKFCASEEVGRQKLSDVMSSLQISAEIIDRIFQIVFSIGYKGCDKLQDNLTLEAKIVQDADRLDALGAIGIARAFAYGGNKQRSLYDPAIQPQIFASSDEYKNSQSTTINHFYEKLLKLPELLFTNAAKKIAQERANFMQIYLDQFYHEWNQFH